MPSVKTLLTFLAIFGLQSLFGQYTEKDIYLYIDQYKELAILKMHEYKIPASITLAQGIFESACGTSRLAKDGNNHFGIKCHKEWEGDTLLVDDDALGECFRKYERAEESFTDHSLFLTTRPRYSELFTLDVMDYKAWAKGLKACGYATNPKYADRLISLIDRYKLAQHDTVYQERVASGSFNVNKGRESIVIVSSGKEQISGIASIDIQEKGTNYFSAKEKEYPVIKYPFSSRKVYQNNRTIFIIASEGDTYAKIAKDLQDTEKNIRHFNDAEKKSQPYPGQVVYVERKAKNNPAKEHVVQSGETLRYISQKYAIQLSQIFKLNQLKENSIIKPGDIIKLK